MRITLFDWERSRSLVQGLFAQLPYECRVETYSNPVAKAQFQVAHTLPVGITPNSVAGTTMGDGYCYYEEADKAMWTANGPNSAGYVFLRCSKASAKCEVRVKSYDR